MTAIRNSPRSPVVVLGAGGTGLFMAHCVSRADGYEFHGFLDDDPAKQADGYGGFPVLGGLSRWQQLRNDCSFLTSLYGSKKMRRFHALVRSLEIPEERWATIVDPAAMCLGATIGKGSFVGPGCVMEPATALGACCALLGNVYVAHHTVLGDYVVCANSASIAGGINIGAASYIGANASIREYLKVGSGAVIGMGAVVCHDVPDDGLVVGNPARPLSRI